MTASWYARYVDGRVTGINSRSIAEKVSAMSWVAGTLNEGLRWRSQDPARPGDVRIFKLVPITDAQAENWRAHRALDYEGDPCTDA